MFHERMAHIGACLKGTCLNPLAQNWTHACGVSRNSNGSRGELRGWVYGDVRMTRQLQPSDALDLASGVEPVSLLYARKEGLGITRSGETTDALVQGVGRNVGTHE